MTGLRPALGAGLLYSLPFGLWLVTGLEPGPLAPDLSWMLPLLGWSQALALVLLLPVAQRIPSARDRVMAAALLVMVPWPLLSLVLAAGSLSMADVVAIHLALGLWALGLGGALALVRRGLVPLPGDLALGLIQGSALLLLVFFYGQGLTQWLPG